MNNFGEVVVVAPDSPQSGMGHAITVGDKLSLVKSNLFGYIESYKCSGTPADCVKIAKHHIFRWICPLRFSIGFSQILSLDGLKKGSKFWRKHL